MAAGRGAGPRLLVRVLGAAAGGGFPQWNDGSPASRRARAGDPAALPASQASIALSTDGESWVLVNASPDLRQQIEANPPLQPRLPGRSSPIRAVLLTNGDVDAVAGLLSLREGTAFDLLAHPRVLRTLDANPIFEVLSRALVRRLPLAVDEPNEITRPLVVVPFAVPGKLPLYLEDGRSEDLDTGALDGDALGLEIQCSGARLVYLANCAALPSWLVERIAGADLLFMDGTLWRDNELIAQGLGRKTGRRMGHISMSGPEGAVARLAETAIGRRVFIHINNSNPALLADSPERRELAASGWEVAQDGMEIRL
ncbi:pyrroloquinoline quinone biosynthesis protein PqqB [Marinimicrococcus flavescens]|uniref:Coenzyme PQQ synthesis protein B n=1 Tax=Marinimicrococcus flavescens TaxID=3031815 RepID=A0AAP3UXV2_9PROT|nr:pyrroloquinoline quinone biosynthesis protein PqqB [Marinimicrococcus flavescens]